MVFINLEYVHNVSKLTDMASNSFLWCPVWFCSSPF